MLSTMAMRSATVHPMLEKCGPALRAVWSAYGYCDVDGNGITPNHGASLVHGVRTRLARGLVFRLFLFYGC